MFLRLSLTVLICGQLLFLDGAFSRDNYMASPGEAEVFFDERDDSKPFDLGLPVIIFEDSLTQHFAWVSSGLGYVPKGVTLELHATGPPTV